MDIKKYLKKDVEISNDDIDMDKLTEDLRKGYAVEKDLTDRLNKEYEKNLAEKTKEYTTKIASMQNDYDSLTAKYNETSNQVKTSNLKVAILSKGFKGEDIEKVSNLRTAVYGQITDDNEALDKVIDEYGKVFFETKVDIAPNEGAMNTMPATETKPVITRNTSIKDLIKGGN